MMDLDRIVTDRSIMVYLIFIIAVVFTGSVVSRDFSTLDHLKAKTSAATQTKAAQDLIKRVLPQRYNDFIAIVDPSVGPQNKDTFNIISNSKVTITGTTGVAVAMGLYYYLTNYCGCQVNWSGKQLNIPQTLPIIQKPGVTITTNDKFRYYENVCTVSYSFAFYNWTDWENQIDWMALHGINLALAFTGQEAIFQRVYMKMGFTMKELQNHFGGPAFLAWARMGNMHGWGGPLPQQWIDDQLILQHKILDRMRSLGIIPVLPGFAGHVPKNITRIFPNVKVSNMADWCGFQPQYCCTHLLDFDDPLFIKIGASVIEEMTLEFGTDHIYNVDTFNEMRPESSSTAYLNKAGSKVYEAMIAGDSQAIWLMQGWLFMDAGFWKPPQIKALLSSVPQGRMIVLDLASDLEAIYARTESYYGQPFIWCMLHNFGGTMELYGMIDVINNRPFEGRNMANSTMIGVGLTPEGIYQNEIMYEFMMENVWRKEPRNITQWISQFAVRRYGKYNPLVDKAWQLLKRSVYNDSDNLRDHSQGVVPSSRPSLSPLLKQDRSVYNATNPALHDNSINVFPTQSPSLIPFVHEIVWYNPKDLYQAWSYMVQAAGEFTNNKLFLYDLVDVTRNSLQILAIKYYTDVVEAYFNEQTADMALAGDRLIQLIKDMDMILASDDHFLFGKWVKSAENLATIDDVVVYIYNARNQVTLWGPKGEINDYACKQWAGLVSGYYLPRWQLFIDMMKDSMYNSTGFDQRHFDQLVFTQVEQPFQTNAPDFPTTPTGNPVQISKTLLDHYQPVTESEFFTKLYKQSISSPSTFEKFIAKKFGIDKYQQKDGSNKFEVKNDEKFDVLRLN